MIGVVRGRAEICIQSSWVKAPALHHFLPNSVGGGVGKEKGRMVQGVARGSRPFPTQGVPCFLGHTYPQKSRV